MSALEQSILNQIMQAGLVEPEHEYPTGHGKTRFDFAWPELRLAVEVEGGTWARGRHSRGAGYAQDVKKYNAATVAGWWVIRVTGDMIKNSDAMHIINLAYAKRNQQLTGAA